MRTLEQQFSIQHAFPVYFSRNVLRAEDPLLAAVLLRGGRKVHRLLCLADSGVLAGWPFLGRELERYALAHGELMELCGPVLAVRGGEECKSQAGAVETILRHIQEHHLCRHSFVLAIGGGAVLDAVGYAAAVAHRGLRLIRMPTTVLGQNDAGVGVKNGINAFGRKNFVGTFAPPFAVINDFDFLGSLPPRELRAGMAEAVKVALIMDPAFFAFLFEQRLALAAFRQKPLEEMIIRCAALHMNHIGTGGDPFETGSARPLDFGHWSAHKLEEITGGQLNHGEAVAIGIALDSLYSARLGLIRGQELDKILVLLADLGLPVYHPALAALDIGGALAEFREHLGGEPAITLLTGIGGKREVDRIDTALMARCIDDLRQKYSSRPEGRNAAYPPPVCGAVN